LKFGGAFSRSDADFDVCPDDLAACFVCSALKQNFECTQWPYFAGQKLLKSWKRLKIATNCQANASAEIVCYQRTEGKLSHRDPRQVTDIGFF
jgi:hypothetical protein